MTPDQSDERNRRQFLASLSSVGLSSTLFPGVLWAKVQDVGLENITAETIRAAAAMAGVEFTSDEIKIMAEGVNRNRARYRDLRTIDLDNSVPPPLHFNPLVPGMIVDRTRRPRGSAKLEQLTGRGV